MAFRIRRTVSPGLLKFICRKLLKCKFDGKRPQLDSTDTVVDKLIDK